MYKRESNSQLQPDGMLAAGHGFVCLFCFLGLCLQDKEIPRLRVQSELHLLAFTSATAMQDPNHICDRHHSSQQYQIPHPLREARD